MGGQGVLDPSLPAVYTPKLPQVLCAGLDIASTYLFDIFYSILLRLWRLQISLLHRHAVTHLKGNNTVY